MIFRAFVTSFWRILMSKFISYSALQIPLEKISLTDIIEIEKERSLAEGLEAMRSSDTGALAVVEQKKMVGIVTESDLIKHFKDDESFWQKQIQEIMTRKPFTLSSQNTIWDCLKLFTMGDFRHVPIMEADGSLTAMLSIKDILNFIVNQFSDTFEDMGTLIKWEVLEEQQGDGSLLVPEKKLESGLSSDIFLTPIRRIATDHVYKLDENSSIMDCIELIRKERVPLVCIMAFETKLLGVISERDILKKFFNHGISSLTNVKSIMTKNPHNLHPKHLLAFGINNMFTYKYRNLLIVDDDLYPYGVINFVDILRFLYHHFVTANSTETESA
jgi:CBS domain-containing protein